MCASNLVVISHADIVACISFDDYVPVVTAYQSASQFEYSLPISSRC